MIYFETKRSTFYCLQHKTTEFPRMTFAEFTEFGESWQSSKVRYSMSGKRYIPRCSSKIEFCITMSG